MEVVNPFDIGIGFSFGSSGQSNTAQYTFTFDVAMNCDLRLDQNNHTRSTPAPGDVQWYS